MPSRTRRLVITWLLLLVLIGVELGISLLPLAPWARTVVLLPAAAMAALVLAEFMEIGRGPLIVRGFAVAGLVWLAVLLGLGTMDPLTRTDYPVAGAHPR